LEWIDRPGHPPTNPVEADVDEDLLEKQIGPAQKEARARDLVWALILLTEVYFEGRD
jgi:hypothetical protein